MLDAGATDLVISEELDVPRRTVNGWRRSPDSLRVVPRRDPWRPGAEEDLYAYALGMYLGDGHIAAARGCFLRISLDGVYPQIVGECRFALERLFAPRATLRLDYTADRGTIIQLSHPDLIRAFPQHGPGKKHERPIVLEPWQREVTARHPGQLLRGLIHSDGCRSTNRFRTKLPSGRVATYEYPRYFFTNLSTDIRGIFCEHCEMLGIRWTQSNHRNISVAHRASVAILDEFVGPKQ